MSRLFLHTPVLCTILVPGILYSSSFSTDTGLELVPRKVPGTKDLIKSKSNSNRLAPGEYLSLDCKLPDDILKKIKYHHRLEPVWWGEGHHGVTFMLHINERNDNWTLFMGVGKGKLCVVSSGVGQQFVVDRKGLLH